MALYRRTFLSGLVTLFGASSADGLIKRVQDLGKPIMLSPWAVEKTLHVYEDGTLLLGGPALDDSRPTWRELLAVEGLPVNDPEQIPRILAERFMESEEELDQPICDVCWPMAFGTTWSPMARAARLLERLNIGPKLSSRSHSIGQLNFHYGDNHPGSSDVWVEAKDDLSVSLLQARLIELKQPIKVIMEAPSIKGYLS
jgi:hypothetical protein